MTLDLKAALRPFADTQPLACKVLLRLAEDQLLRSAIEYLVATEADYVPRIAPALAILAKVYAARGQDFDVAVEAVLEYTHLYMRHQVSFLQKGSYSNTSFEKVYEDVYDNEELMVETYLPGLYLTQLFWPVHYRVLQLYEGDFLALAGERPPARLLEFGVGHGMTLLLARRHFPAAEAVAYDVSRHSLEFGRQLLKAAGSDEASLHFLQQDVTKLEQANHGLCQLGTMGEVLEHVEQPQNALRNFRKLLERGAPAFITTVIDSNAVDHIYQFSSQAEIDDMIGQADFEIVQSTLIKPSELRLSGEPGNDPTRYYAGMFRAR